VIGAVARGAEGVLTDPPPRAPVSGFGNFAALLDVFRWIGPPERNEAVEVTDRVVARAKPALTGAGIDTPCPTMQASPRDRTEDTGGDRARWREGWPARRRPRPAPARPRRAGPTSLPERCRRRSRRPRAAAGHRRRPVS
jgi:hypothetical protein